MARRVVEACEVYPRPAMRVMALSRRDEAVRVTQKVNRRRRVTLHLGHTHEAHFQNSSRPEKRALKQTTIQENRTPLIDGIDQNA